MNEDNIPNIIANEIIEKINTKWSPNFEAVATIVIQPYGRENSTIRLEVTHQNKNHGTDISIIIYVGWETIKILPLTLWHSIQTNNYNAAIFPLENPKSIEQTLEYIQVFIQEQTKYPSAISSLETQT